MSMLIERRQTPRNEPKLTDTSSCVPICRIEQIGPYGLFFAYRKDGTRPAPGTNYLHAWLHWTWKYFPQN